MSANLRHSQLFHLLKSEHSDTNPDNKPISLDDDTALLLLRRAKASWLRPSVDYSMDLPPVAKPDHEFLGTVRA
jgi:hypothetical protein